MKVDLIIKRPARGYRGPENTCLVEVRRALPFYKSKMGMYTHRVQSMTIHFWDGVLHHASYSLWCGMMGSDTRGTLLADTVQGTFCATCEGRAIGAGQIGSHKICGRMVKFSPRLPIGLNLINESST